MYYSKAQTDGSTCESSHSSRCLSQSDWLGDYLDVITFSGITVKIEKESDQELEGKCEVNLHDQKLEGKCDVAVHHQELEGKCEVALHDLELGQCDIVVLDQEFEGKCDIAVPDQELEGKGDVALHEQDLEGKCEVYVADQELEGKGNVVVHDQELEGKCDVAGHDQELEGKCDVAVPDQELEEKGDVVVHDQELEGKCDVYVADQELEGKCDVYVADQELEGKGNVVVHDQELDGKCDVDVEEESYGFIDRLYLILAFFLFCCACVNGNPIETKVDWQSDSMVLVFGETWNLTCSKNDLIVNETCIWSRRNLKSAKTETINFGNKPKNSTKFEIDGAHGSTLVIKNVNEEDIRDYCYFCRIGTTPSECKNMLDQKNHVEINVDESCNNSGPPDQCKDPMSNCIEVSGDYKCSCNPGYYNNGGTCTAEINVDESCNNTRPPYQCKDPMSNCTEVVSGDYKCTCNPGYYNSGGTCTINKVETGLSHREIVGLSVGGFVFIAVGIVLAYIFKRRQDRNDTNDGDKISMEQMDILE